MIKAVLEACKDNISQKSTEELFKLALSAQKYKSSGKTASDPLKDDGEKPGSDTTKDKPQLNTEKGFEAPKTDGEKPATKDKPELDAERGSEASNAAGKSDATREQGSDEKVDNKACGLPEFDKDKQDRHGENLGSDSEGSEESAATDDAESGAPDIRESGGVEVPQAEDDKEVQGKDIPPPGTGIQGSAVPHTTPTIASSAPQAPSTPIPWLYTGIGSSVVLILVIVVIVWFVRRSSRSRRSNSTSFHQASPGKLGPPPEYSPAEKLEKEKDSAVPDLPLAGKI